MQSVKALLREKNVSSCCHREADDEVDGMDEAGDDVEGEEEVCGGGGPSSSDEPRLGPSFCLTPGPVP